MTFPVTADMVVKPGMEEKFEAIIRGLTETVRAREPGVQAYQLYRMAKVPGKYRMLEIYADRAAFDLHMKSEHIAAILPDMLACLVGNPTIDKLESVG